MLVCSNLEQRHNPPLSAAGKFAETISVDSAVAELLKGIAAFGRSDEAKNIAIFYRYKLIRTFALTSVRDFDKSCRGKQTLAPQLICCPDNSHQLLHE